MICRAAGPSPSSTSASEAGVNGASEVNGTLEKKSREVSLLVSDAASPPAIATELRSTLTQKGYDTVSFCSLTNPPSAATEEGQDIISLLDIESPTKTFFQTLNETTFRQLIDFLTKTHLGPGNSSNKMLWLTGLSQVGQVTNPHSGLVLGFARTIRLELGVFFSTFELDPTSATGWTGAVTDVLAKLQREGDDNKDWKQIDLEYALVDGLVQIPRSITSTADELLLNSKTSQEDSQQGSVVHSLKINRPGLLSSLSWTLSVSDPTADDLADDQLEIKVHAASVTPQDVSLALGARSSSTTSSRGGLGSECAGVVVRSGHGTNFEVGDRVLCFSPSTSALSTHVNIPSRLAVKIPEGLTFSQAVTLPAAFGTAIRSLIEIGSLTEGDTLLIHSACDATGIAAIQVAKSLGIAEEEIFVTCSNNDSERDFLSAECGIPETNIFSSTDNSFVADVMHVTEGRGVDLVLNSSLSGELLHASWKCVAEGGNMVDLSGKDAAGNGALKMGGFDGNRSFHGLDLGSLVSNKPAVGRRLLEKVLEIHEQGQIEPISPVTKYSPGDIKTAFGKFQAGQRPIGAVVVDFEDDSTFPTENSSGLMSSLEGVKLRKDRSYLLVGGLGGLGKSAAVWLAEHGAGSIILFSRSASTFDDESVALMRELEAYGTEVQFVAGSVLDVDDINALVGSVTKPIAGVLNLAVILKVGFSFFLFFSSLLFLLSALIFLPLLCSSNFPSPLQIANFIVHHKKDESLLDLTFSSWSATTSAKVTGSFNLHTSLLRTQPDHPLDFFILLGSIYGVQGNPKQANYAAASTFMDSFVAYRHGMGLAASVIDLGVMEDIGFVSENKPMLDSLKRAGAQLIGEKDFLGALGLAIRSGAPTANKENGKGLINKGQFVVGLGQHAPDARRIGMDTNLGSSSGTSGDVGVSTSGGGGKADSGGKNNALREFISRLKRDGASALADEQAAVQFLAEQVGECLKTLLIFSDSADLNLKLGLSELGVDSLIAIELQSWWVQQLGVSVTILELTNSPSVLDLGRLARKRLLDQMGASTESVNVKEKANGVVVGVVEVAA